MNTNKLKEEYKNKEEDEPKIKKKENQIVKIFLFALQLIIFVMIFFITSGSLVYFIKESSKEVINKVLPSKCDEYPYGGKNLNPCNDKNSETSSAVSQITGLLTDVLKFVEPKAYKTLKGYMPNTDKPNIEAGIPYKWYHKNTDNIFYNYLNWFLISLAETQINLHSHIKNVMNWINGLSISKSYSLLMGISGFLFMLSLPLIHFYTLISLVIRQLTTFWKHGIIEMILIILSGFFIWFLDTFISTFNVIRLVFELVIRPMFTKSQREVIMNIVRKENVLIGYIFGFVFLQILYKIKMDKHIGKPLKTIPTVIFFIIVIIHLIKFLYGLGSSIA